MQVFPTSPEVIYNTLVADATFMAEIGTYEWTSGGSAVPAIGIVTPGDDLPATRNVQGIECVIHDMGHTRRQDYYNSVNVFKDWSVYLICWAPASGEGVNIAVDRMLSLFRGSTSMEVVAVSDGLGARAQALVTVPSEFPIIS